jgi:hypothetical protein
MNNLQWHLQASLEKLDPWLDSCFPVATALICSQQRLAGYTLLSIYLLVRLLQRSDREPWRWILISLLIVNAGLIIQDRDMKPGGASDYLIVALGFAAGFQKEQHQWKSSLPWIASCILPLLGLSIAAGDQLIQGNSSFTGFNINRVSYLAGLLSVTAYSTFMAAQGRFAKLGSLTLLAGSTIETLLCGSRASILAPAIAIAIDQGSRIQWTAKRISLALLATTISAILILSTWYGAPEQGNPLAADSNRIETIKCWISSTANSSRRLAFGHGYGKAAQKDCGPDAIPSLKDRDTPLSHSHNTFVQVFAETGSPGLILGILLTIAATRKAIQQKGSGALSNFSLSVLAYILMMAMVTTWQSMLLNQVLIGYCLSSFSVKVPEKNEVAETIPAIQQP